MKKKFRAVIPGLTGSCRFFLTASLLILFSLNSLSQQNKNLPREHYGDEAGKLLKGASYLKDGINSPYPSFVRFGANERVGFNQFFSWLRSNINSNAALDFRTVKTESDELGFQHHRYVQTYQNIPIDKSYYILHVKDNLVNSFNGNALDIPGKISAKPGLSEALALQMVLKFVGASKYKWEDAYWTEELKKTRKDSKASYYPQGELVWNTGRENNSFQLAYKFDIYSASPDKAQRIYIDASSGAIIRTLPLESNCTPATVNTIFNGSRSISTDNYSGSLYRLRDNCIGSVFYIRDWGSTTTTASPTEIENTTNTWNNNNDERFGASVLWNTKQSDSYWRTVHSRSGYDNSNGDVNGYINAVFSCAPPAGCTYTDNASMSFSGGTMKVGLGSSGTLANSWSCLDIIGHEFTHAVTGSSAALDYQDESGALNESFSDIFGEAIENFSLGSNDWLMGDERTSGHIRNMSNPNAKGDPDTYEGTNWFTGTGDNGGVHTNSGVQNFWFYLLTVGGSGTNDNGDAYNVSGIGLGAARAIAARNLTHYLGSSSNYSDARSNAIQSAVDLYGACSNEVKQTTNAWYAVGVGDQFFDANAAVTSNYNGRAVSCFNACDGSATVNVISGVAPLYLWSTGATTPSVSGLCPGPYSVTVKNILGLGCQVTKTITIANTPLLTASPAVTSNYNGYGVSCFGSHNGSAAANPSGGTPPYSYSWSNGATTNTISGLGAGAYSVTVTDANGCSTGGGVMITQPPLLTSTAAPTTNYNGYNVRCNGGSDGAAEAYPVGGVPPYSYLWSNGQTTKVATGLSATTYTCVITDANGCTTSSNTTLTEPPPLTINAGSNKIVYLGYPDSACTNLTATGAGGGVPPYVLTWSTGSHAATINVCPVVSTVYTITITDANNCSVSDEVRVCVIDVRCGNHLDKVTLCHATGSGANTLCVALPGAITHIQKHGDQLAACGTVKVCDDAAPAVRSGGSKDANMIELSEAGLYVKAFPNPLSTSSTIRFMLYEDDVAGLSLVDISGKQITTLFSGKVEGYRFYDVNFDRKSLANGMYYLRLNSRNGRNAVLKILIVK